MHPSLFQQPPCLSPEAGVVVDDEDVHRHLAPQILPPWNLVRGTVRTAPEVSRTAHRPAGPPSGGPVGEGGDSSVGR